jgi:hypothetical protein
MAALITIFVAQSVFEAALRARGDKGVAAFTTKVGIRTILKPAFRALHDQYD